MAAKYEFEFCKNSRVAEVIAPEEPKVKDFNGWDYTPTPVVPYRRSFKITLEGLRWYTNEDGLDVTTDPEHNAGRLEKFYEEHRLHVPFVFNHEYLGLIELRFSNPLNVPKAMQNSQGLLEPLEFTAMHHNPSF